MRKLLCAPLAVIALLLAWQTTSAQNDSLLDLGRIKTRKDHVQSITIKGADLEKIPFGTISEVIAPFLHGAMTSRANLVFVVDGNMVNDVNAWSIYDIEEITLVQNAMAQVNGAINQQQLVLVKTKRNQSPGITVAASAALTKNYADDPGGGESQTNFYHQYHIAARKNLGRISLGASVNYVRDVNPLNAYFPTRTKTPYQLNRFRFNGWLDFKMAEGHTISVGLNYVPQTVKYDHIFDAPGNSSTRWYAKLEQSMFNPYVKLSGRVAPGLTNELSVSYLTAKRPGESFQGTDQFVIGPPNPSYYSESRQKNKLSNLLVREQISYTRQVGNWVLAPSVNFTYRSIKDNWEEWNAYGTVGNPPSIGFSTSQFKMESFVLTPVVGISYKNSFHLAGGVAASLTDDTKPFGDGVFPFASVMLDVFRIGNTGTPESLKVFGSFSRGPNFADMYYSQASVSNDVPPSHTPVLQPIMVPGLVVVTPFPDKADRNSLNLGAGFSTAGDEFEVSYNFNDRRYVDMLMYTVNGPTGYQYLVLWPEYQLTSHRLGAQAKIAEAGKFEWRAGLNVTTFKTRMRVEAVMPGPIESVSNNDKANWTGGFTNRISAGRFSFGLDLLYLLNEQRPLTPASFEKINSWRLNTVYVGYTAKLMRSRPVECYLVSRNMLNDDHRSFAGSYTQYFGAGFKFEF